MRRGQLQLANEIKKVTYLLLQRDVLVEPQFFGDLLAGLFNMMRRLLKVFDLTTPSAVCPVIYLDPTHL